MSSLPTLPSTGISTGPCARQAASGLLHFYLGRAGLDSTSAVWVLCTPPNSVSLPSCFLCRGSHKGPLHFTDWKFKWHLSVVQWIILEEHMRLELFLQHLENFFYLKKWILLYHQQWSKLTKPTCFLYNIIGAFKSHFILGLLRIKPSASCT